MSVSLFLRSENDLNAAAIGLALRLSELLPGAVALPPDEPRSTGIQPGLATLHARRNLLRGGIRRPAGSDENLAQNLRHLRRIAVFQTEGPQRGPCRVRPVKTIDPLRGLGQQLGVLRYHHHCIHARDRLEADDALSQSAFAGFEYPLQLCDHRLRRGRFERINADRLVLQPFHVEGRDYVERGLTLLGRTLDQQQISGLNHANCART